MAWWGVSIGPVVIVVAAVAGAVLVIASPLRVVTPLTPAAIVTGLGLVVVAM